MLFSLILIISGQCLKAFKSIEFLLKIIHYLLWFANGYDIWMVNYNAMLKC